MNGQNATCSDLRLLYFLLSCPGQTCSWQWRVVPHCRAWNGVLHQYDGPHAHLRPPRGSARPEPGTEIIQSICKCGFLDHNYCQQTLKKEQVYEYENSILRIPKGRNGLFSDLQLNPEIRDNRNEVNNQQKLCNLFVIRQRLPAEASSTLSPCMAA